MTDRRLTRRHILLAAAALAVPATLALPRAARAAEPQVFVRDGLAIGGTDPVAYFTQGAPVPGTEAHVSDWNGAQWRFSNAQTKAMFDAEPDRYAPRYGGYCAFAVANNYTASTDPEAWSIEDGKLYLNFSRGVRRRWLRDVPGHIAAGDANWPSVLER